MRREFKIDQPAKYTFLSRGALDIKGVDDAKQLSVTMKAMNVVGIQQSEQKMIFR